MVGNIIFGDFSVF